MTSFVSLHYRIPIYIVCILSLRILYYRFACVSSLCVSVLVFVCLFVRLSAVGSQIMQTAVMKLLQVTLLV